MACVGIRYLIVTLRVVNIILAIHNEVLRFFCYNRLEREIVIDQKARELVLKARLLRLFALIFAIAGLLIFFVLYMKNIDGTLLSALTNPFIIFIILVPFLPAAVLSWMASRLEKQYDLKYRK